MGEIKQYVFFDFEMLCSNKGMPFSEMQGIRLGAVKYTISTETVDYFDQFIKPINSRPLSPFCKHLTGISDSDLENAQPFDIVFEDFLNWVGGIKKTQFFSWSKSDLSRLKLDAERHQISNLTIKKIEKRYIDFQAIFTKRVSKTQFSVENALQLYNLSFIGEKHNPMYDAYNTLRIYLSFLNKPVQSDLAMLKQYIFHDLIWPPDYGEINAMVNEYFTNDINHLLLEIQDISTMKNMNKILRSCRKLVEKYENILLNRSGIFSKEVINKIRDLVEFYYELLVSYQEHIEYSAKIIILNEHIMKPIYSLAVKRG